MEFAFDAGLQDNGEAGPVKIIIFPAHISVGYMRSGVADLTGSEGQWLYARHNVEPEYQSVDPKRLLSGLLSVLQIRQRGSVLSCSNVNNSQAGERFKGRPPQGWTAFSFWTIFRL
jgi:hypothetical protein